MSSIIDYFKMILTVQLFYAFAITVLVHNIPAADLDNVVMFERPTETIDLESVGSELEEKVSQELNLPLIDLGALVFYSGNIIVDMLVNFITAVPQMFTLLIEGFLLFFNVESFIAVQIKLFFWVLIMILYVLSLLMFIMSIRSRGAII